MIREAHAKVLAKQGGGIDELLPVTQEDVEDEAEHLEALGRVEAIDFDQDESEVDMNAISPQMRALFN